jgi:alkanesulfonate monooxygenase SsuD/methylene tetrahydromethanopterin reductase-like flavin-dependent oxidoreductase (luciferase family)
MANPLKYAVHVHTFGDYAHVPRLVALAREAEAAGWDGFFVTDHLTARGRSGPAPIADPWIALAAVASATRRVRIGPMVAALPRRRPWQVASEAVTLDHLSGGRLVLGVGSGTLDERNFLPFGEEPDLPTRGRMLDEALTVLAGLWSGRPFSHQGEHYRVHEVTFLPQPLQSPRIPIWVAGTWPHRRPFRRAARWDGFFADVEGVDWEAGQIMAPEDLRTIVAYVREHRRSKDPFDVVIGGRTPDDPARAATLLAPYAGAGLTWWVEGVHERFGTPDAHLARIRRGPPRAA